MKSMKYSGVNVFNHLPQNIKNLSWNMNKFKLALKKDSSDGFILYT